MTDQDALELAARLAARAAAAINAVRAAGFAVERKGDDSPVTEADRIAEALIVEGLREAAPGLPVVAEEEVAAGIITAPAERFWLVDPLDGTKEFAKGLDEFAVCIGLVAAGRPVLGVLALPATGEVFGGLVAARQAWKQQGEAGARTPIAARPMPGSGAVLLDSRSHPNPRRMAGWLADRKLKLDRVQPMGSAMKFARIAEGAADVAPRLGPTMEWDTAAGQALLEAAGGRVLDEAGAPLRYGKPGWRNGGFVAEGRR
ncbi:3'(2'),5'-bisphosphate nucleotidase CysQ [Siccirubricoccus sp. KC 17139]|uniref:3'(2'),5'-bisphosphate nucleotidase CysQ n=1 Tax=Siccirubricoccus soli TaxID=2899147 RepID=A0ABT1D9J6_9PROT|nr:3'(2'),5'-bisphosphate nucleotidase CysQ [Siccirubricoccus soli]MCO6418598.1 3'(2'),5'-bisphosphate nucleotidase CysQ [Siccirubricoccus soli]MCP2684733.1 3'(2'),5'-bisphosphate nucleotidase CysQ [Siccirubricoccus soli]